MSKRTAISNPLASLRRRQWMLWCLAAPMFVAAAWWALAPLGTTLDDDGPQLALDDSKATPGGEAGDLPGHSTDPNTFAINLWAPTPPPPPPTAQAATATPPQPLNIQLIGIITDAQDGRAIQKAALYDADEDRLLIVADGERVRDHLVRVLAGGVVELSDGRSSRRLMLRPDEHPVHGPGGAG